MYPYDVFLGMDLYEIMLAVGFFGALVFFRIFADRRGFSARLQNLCIIGAMVGIIGGYGAAVLFQAFYNGLSSGTFEVTGSTGATFYGGLIGGAAFFLLVYFGIGNLILKDGQTQKRFFELSEIAAGSIALAHGFGRLGCLFAGCCHGKVTDAWYGVHNVYLNAKTVPVQLFEAIFLFALAALFAWRLCRGSRGNFGLYLVAYAVWRFAVEYLRTDDRGASPVGFLSPSQLTAIILLAVGFGFWWLEKFLRAKGDKEDGT